MQTSTLPIEHYRESKTFFRSRRAGPRQNAGTRNRLDLARRGKEQDEIVASFGAANLIHLQDGRWELRSGTSMDHAAAREGSLLFQPEATFPGQPLPVSAEKPQPANAVPKCVLIADDDNMVRGSLTAVLESEGYVVDEARNGIEAVTRAIARTPDLVLLDLNMPHWDGWTAFSQLDRVTPLLPVIVITARPNQYPKAVQLGVDAFMEKPLNFPILLRAIKYLTREDKNRHLRRVTNRAFVTKLLGGPPS